jgi:uncharacterized protein YjbI with pentapeptide repeats
LKTEKEHILVNINALDKCFENKYMENILFKDCDFSNQNLSSISFIGCEFVNCNLSGVKLYDTRLNEVVFNESKLVGVDFGLFNDFICKMEFRRSIMDFSVFPKKKLAKTQFIECSMKECSFEETDLSGVLFDKVDLERTSFIGCNLSKADFYTAYHYEIDAEANLLTHARFSLSEVKGLLSKYKLKIEE